MRSLVGLVAVLSLALASPASAVVGDADGTEFAAEKTNTGYVVEVSAWSNGGTVTPGENPLAGCTILAGLDGPTTIDYAGGRGIEIGITNPEMEAADATYVFITCPERIFDGFAWAVWEEGDPPPPEVVDALAASARSAIVLPPLTPESAPDGLITPFLTQLPVWLWVPEASWVPVSGTASLAELGVSITATATPVTTSWLTGDSDSPALTCGAGTPWDASLDDSVTDCAVTYGSTTAPGETFDLTVTTSFDVAFVCSPGLCVPGDIDLPGFEITVSRPVTVTEARGVLSR